MSKELKNVYAELDRNNLKNMLIRKNFKLEAYSDQWLDAIIHFLNCLIEKLHQGQSDKDGYIYLKSEYLSNTYGDKKREGKLYYKRLVDILKATDIIQVNDSYLVKFFCKKYRINPQFKGALINEWIQTKSYYKAKTDLSPAAVQHLNDLSKLDFNAEEAESIIKRLSYIQRLNLPSSVYKWAQNQLNVSDEDKTRIYSTLTGLPKQFRGCLSYQGEDLYSVDLKQAHPYLLIKIMKNWVNRNCTANFEVYVQNHPDISIYIEDVTSTSFIPKIYEQIKKNKKEQDYDNLKVGILAQVFYAENKINLNKISKAFSDLYPSVWFIISKLKPEDSRDLSKQLIKLESKIMNRAVKQLYERHEGSLFIRLHDCVITTKDLVGETVKQIEAEGLKLIEHIPKLSQTLFNVASGELHDIQKPDKELSDEFYIHLNEELKEYRRKMRIEMFKGGITYVERLERCDRKTEITLSKRDMWKNQARSVTLMGLKKSA